MAAPAVARLAETVGIPKTLAGFGLREAHVEVVVDEAMTSGNVAVNPRQTSRDELAGILRCVL